jgi:hypothetical protein
MTMKLLKRADSLMPMTRRVVMRPMRSIAGRLMIAPVWVNPSAWVRTPAASNFAVSVYWSGALVSAAGMLIPSDSRMKAVKYPDHPTATVDAPKRYSRIRSQPMIQAMNSPRVA